MRSASTSADEGSIRLRNLHSLRDFPNLEGPEPGLDFLYVAFLIQPLGHAGRVPPRVCHCVIGQGLGNVSLGFFALGLCVTLQSDLRHCFPRCFNGTRAAVAVLYSLRATDLTDFYPTRRGTGSHLKVVSSSFASPTLSERSRQRLNRSGRSMMGIPQCLRHPLSNGRDR
jgi:hypothetical protein